MITGLRDITAATRTEGMAAIQSAAVGDTPWVNLVDEVDIRGNALKTAMDAADAAAAEAPTNLALRMDAAFAYAVYRDFRYATAAGRYPYALGIHQGLRGHYEAGATYNDATV